MLRSFDSWYAVAIAIVTARGDRSRSYAFAAMSEAHLACSASTSTVRSPTCATQ